MVSDKTLRHHTSPVRHIRVISKSKDAGCRKHGWEEGFGPGFGRFTGGPCRFTIAGQAVDKDNAGWEKLGLLPNIAVHVLYCPIIWAAEQFEPGREDLS